MKPHFPPNAGVKPQSALLNSQVSSLQALESASPADLQTYQARALSNLFNHAYRYSPFWRERLGRAGYQLRQQDHGHLNEGQPARISADNALDLLRHLPMLTRNDLQARFADIRARPAEMAASRIITASSSGSTGTPVRVEKDGPVYSLFYAAYSWIESLWHYRDPRQKIAVTLMTPGQSSSASWGEPFATMGYHGPSISRGWQHDDAANHLDWLLSEQPTYLRCTASIAAELAELALQRGDSLQLTQILSQSERVSPRHRMLCQRAFGAAIIDRYSCEEAGWLAIQCATQQNLHVLSGTVLLEILDDHDQPCPPGVAGRVVITSLHSFAMPLIRYELGDLAEWGPPCACGITLPVIGALRGRLRHRVQLPDGRKTMPFIGDELGEIPAIRQFRIIQHRSLALELQVAGTRALSAAETSTIRGIFRDNGLGTLPLTITELATIDWPEGGKREEFVSLL
jgi:phenylacetate-CoA ligase